MYHKGRNIPLLLLLCVGQRAQPATLTSEQLLEEALTNNREIAAIRQRIAEAKGLLRQAGVRPAPTLDASGASGQPWPDVRQGRCYAQPARRSGSDPPRHES